MRQGQGQGQGQDNLEQFNRFLVIENRGEVDPNAFALMGASTKRADGHSIGCFGTGTKYAIAVLCKERIDMTVVVPGKYITFMTQPAKLRGMEFEQVVMKIGAKTTPLSFTTEMGLHWGVEEALRELVSNAYDEEEKGVVNSQAKVYVAKRIGNKADAPDGFTRIYIRMTPKVEMFHARFDEWFTFNRKPLETHDIGWRSGACKVFAKIGEGTRVYRRGVKVFEDREMHSAYDYQMDGVNVREDRTAEFYSITAYIGFLFDKLGVELKRKVLESVKVKGSLESRSSVSWGELSSQDWKAVVGESVVVSKDVAGQFAEELIEAGHRVEVLPENWVGALTMHGGEGGVQDVKGVKDVLSGTRVRGYRTLDRSELEQHEFNMLDYALVFTEMEMRFEIDPHKVKIFETEDDKDSSLLGEYIPEDDLILINRRVFTLGTRELVETLVEEWLHRKTGGGDKTRKFQAACIKEVVEQVCRLKGVVL